MSVKFSGRTDTPVCRNLFGRRIDALFGGSATRRYPALQATAGCGDSKAPAESFPQGKPARTRDVAIDILKIMAIFGVVVGHSCDLLLDSANRDMEMWWYGNVFFSFIVYCVPLFVMCSGAMLLSSQKVEPPLSFYAKRLHRILVPLIVWSVVYYIYKIGENPLTVADIPRFIKDFLSAKILPQLWFLYMLIGLYLSAPFLQMIMRQAKRSHLWVFVFLCLIVAPPHPLILYGFGVIINLNFSIFSTFIGLFVLGYLLQTTKPVALSGRLGLFALYLLMVAVTLLGDWDIRVHDATGRPLFLEFDATNVTLMSVALFLLVRSLPLGRLAPWGRAITVVSNASYGIYLVHILVRYCLKHGLFGFKLTALTFTPVVGVLLTAATIFLLSLVITLILKKIPYVRRAVG
jgi:surface polysaccharide O-acyltransferase-like enzyme